MSLKAFKLAKAKVSVPGTSEKLELGALSFEAIMTLFQRHKATAAAMYLRFVAGGQPGSTGMVAVFGTLLTEAPELCADIIAHAAGDGGDPEAVEIARSLPFPTQAEALQTVAALTFGRLEDGGVKKFLETITNALVVVNEVMGEITTAIQQAPGTVAMAAGASALGLDQSGAT